MTSRVWGNVAREIIAEHLMDGTSWAGPGCAMYAYAWAYGVTGCKHPGFDIAMPHGTPIYAARGGKVVQMRNPGQSGRMSVNIEDATGERQEYVHFSRTDVSMGQVVQAGHRLGLSGTFNSPHLHFEHWRKNASTSSGWSYLNPEAILTTEASAPVVPPAAGGGGLAAINGDFRQIGDVTAKVYEDEFRRLGSPMLAQATAIRNAAAPMSALALAQMFMENKYSTTGFIIKPEDNNPLAMRPWNADPRRNGNKPVIHWQTRAVIEQMNLPAHYAGAIKDGSGNYFARFNSVADCLAEYKHRLQANSPYKNGVYNNARTLRDMLAIYAPAGDVHPVTGVANADSGYYNTVVTMLTKYVQMQGGAVVTPSQPGVPSGQHRFILAMGHRNTDRGGAAEMAWTPKATRAVRDAIKAHGGQAWIVQEEDSDNDPDWFPGGLQAMARRAVELNSKYGPFMAYISQHFNGGGGRGGFAIHPESHDSSDTKASNGLSVTLARNFAKRLKETNTVPLLSWMRDSPGVMSEKESGVGAQGYRLGEFVGAMGFDRSKTARVILEAGGGDVAADQKYLNDAHWLRYVYAEAVVKALKDTFGEFATSAPVKFTAGQAVQLASAHRLHTTPADSSETTVNLPAGQKASIITGPSFDGAGKAWWNIRVEGTGTGWVKETANDGTVVLVAAGTVQVPTPGTPDVPTVPAPVDPSAPPDNGPEGWIHLPMDGTWVAQETVMGRDFTLDVVDPVQWVPGRLLGGWAAKVEPATTNYIRNPYVDSAVGVRQIGQAAPNVNDFPTSVAATGVSQARNATTGNRGFSMDTTTGLSAGQVYTGSAVIRPDKVANGRISIQWRNSAGTLLSETAITWPQTIDIGGDAGPVSADGMEQRVFVTGTAPANTAMASVAVYTISGALNDVLRASGFQLEPGRAMTSLVPQFEKGTKNLLRNPFAAWGLDGIRNSDDGIGQTIDRVVAWPDEYGEWTVETRADGAGASQGVFYQSRTAIGWTGRALTLVGSIIASSPESAANRIMTRINYTDGTYVDSVWKTIEVTPEPTRFTSNTITVNAAKVVSRVELFVIRMGAMGSAWSMRTAGAMVEVGSEASGIAEGSHEGTGVLMPGYAWGGTPNDSASTRAAGKISAARGDLNFNGNAGTVYIRARVKDLPPDGVERRLMGIGTPATSNRNSLNIGIIKAANGSIQARVTATNASTSRVATTVALASPPEWVLITVDWQNSQPARVRLQNGAWASTSTNWFTNGLWGAPLYIGTDHTGTGMIYGDAIDDLIHFDRKLTTAQDATVQAANYWTPNMLLSGVQDIPHEPVPGDTWNPAEKEPYTPPPVPTLRLGAEPFIVEGRQYSVTLALYRGTILGQIKEPLRLNYDGELRVIHSDDAPIKRTMSFTVNDIVDLKDHRAIEAYSDSVIPVMVVTDDYGRSRREQLGAYLIHPYAGTDYQTHTTTTLHTSDLTWLLARTPIIHGWTAPGNTEIGSIVRDRLLQLGVPPGQIAIGDTGRRTPPEGVPFFPGTTWLDSLNHLLNMARWYGISVTRRAVFTSMPWIGKLGEASPVMHYDTRRGHFITNAVERDPDWGQFGNIAIARKLPTSRGDTSFSYASINDNVNSPTSTRRLGPVLIQPVIDGAFESEAECKAAADAQRSRGQSFFNRISITTGVEMTAEAHQVVAVDIERAGMSLVTGRWWRQSWETVYNGVSAYTEHHLNHVEVYT